MDVCSSQARSFSCSLSGALQIKQPPRPPRLHRHATLRSPSSPGALRGLPEVPIQERRKSPELCNFARTNPKQLKDLRLLFLSSSRSWRVIVLALQYTRLPPCGMYLAPLHKYDSLKLQDYDRLLRALPRPKKQKKINQYQPRLRKNKTSQEATPNMISPVWAPCLSSHVFSELCVASLASFCARSWVLGGLKSRDVQRLTTRILRKRVCSVALWQTETSQPVLYF